MQQLSCCKLCAHATEHACLLPGELHKEGGHNALVAVAGACRISAPRMTGSGSGALITLIARPVPVFVAYSVPSECSGGVGMDMSRG